MDQWGYPCVGTGRRDQYQHYGTDNSRPRVDRPFLLSNSAADYGYGACGEEWQFGAHLLPPDESASDAEHEKPDDNGDQIFVVEETDDTIHYVSTFQML